MAHITLSVPDEMYAEMKKHPHIKWSEAARQGIKQQLSGLKGVISGKELLSRLSPETRKAIDTIPEKEWIRGYKQMKKGEKRRLKLLTQALSSAKQLGL